MYFFVTYYFLNIIAFRYFSMLITTVVLWLLSHVQLFVTPGTAAHQASLSFTISQSLLKLMSIESVMPSNHLILCHPLLLLPSIFPSIRVFSSESKCMFFKKERTKKNVDYTGYLLDSISLENKGHKFTRSFSCTFQSHDSVLSKRAI